MKVCVFSKIMSAALFAPLMGGGGDKRVIERSPTSEDKITMIGGLQKHQTPRNDGICPCINSAAGMGGGQTPIAIRPSFRVRKLTQKECWRLMGFQDQDFERAKSAMNENIYGGADRSGSQLYKQAGNSIVVDVLCAILDELHSAMPYLFEDMTVGSFFSGIGAFEKALSTFDITDVSDKVNYSDKNDELKQLGYINDYNGDANRVYDGETIEARRLTMEKVRIKQATQKGYIECAVGGVADLSYPSSKTRRGRVQEGGWICPTITATETGICRIERGDSYEHCVEKPP